MLFGRGSFAILKIDTLNNLRNTPNIPHGAAGLASFPITLVFQDGEAVRLDCRSFETVVQAAERSRLHLFTDCREGGCGTCKASIQSGQFSLDDYSGDALSEAEFAEGRILACRLRPESPCVVEFDYPLAAIRRLPAAPPRMAAIVELARLADDVVELTLEANDGKPFNFIPGQYAKLQTPDTAIVRSYSFVNEPGTSRAVFLIRLLRDGAMSAFLQRQSAPGAALLVAAPFGRFFLRDAARPLLFVAGGTGIGPVLSMLQSLKRTAMPPPSVQLAFGVNSVSGLFYREELQQLMTSFPGAKLTIAVMQPEAPWQGFAGTAVDAIAALDVEAGSHAYLCGPPAMIERAQPALCLHGLDRRAVFTEAFLPTAEPKAA
jgi:benzoate/toluate 1,2-dioxygenase reductase component